MIDTLQLSAGRSTQEPPQWFMAKVADAASGEDPAIEFQDLGYCTARNVQENVTDSAMDSLAVAFRNRARAQAIWKWLGWAMPTWRRCIPLEFAAPFLNGFIDGLHDEGFTK